MILLIVIFMTFKLTVVCLSSSLPCEGELCSKVISMPLVDNMKASLKADIDVSQINKYLKAYIKQEINTELRTIMKDVVEEIIDNRTSSTMKKTISRQEGKSLNESCSSTRECKETLTCEKQFCQCSSTDHWNGMQCEERKSLNESCSSTRECNETLTCERQFCQCSSTDHWNGMQCEEKKSLNESCSSTRECKETLTCEKQFCQCSSTDHWNGMQCEERKSLNESCSSTRECKETLTCEKQFCQCSSTDHWNGMQCEERKSLNESCSSTRECNERLTCERQFCQCSSTDHWNGMQCEERKSFNESCSSTRECKDTLTCEKQFCQCSSTDHWNGMQCEERKSLNGSCSSTRECKDTLTCTNRYCQCISTEQWNGMQCMGNSKGVRFTIVFTEKGYLKETKLLLASKKDGLLSQYTFFDNRNKTIRFTNTQYSLHLPLDNIVIKKGIEKVGMEVESSVPISLYGIQDRDNGGYTEAYMAIPRKYLSTNYLLPSFKVYRGADSALTITTTEESTTVTINLRMEKGPLRYNNVNYNNNDVISLVLNKFYSFKLSHSSDLSGTTIQATKPISVLTSSKANQVTGKHSVNELLEMILPLNQIDNFYVIPVIVTRPTSTVRVYCPEETTLSLYNGNTSLTKHVEARDFIDITHHKISYINGNRDFLVMIIPHELPGGTGTVFMMTIHGVNQYMSTYDFAVPAIDNLKSHITVCVKSSALSGFTLDGQPTTVDGVYNISNGADRYSTLSLPISPGKHNIIHTGGARFGLWVYGENTEYDAYGYPAGIAFKKKI